MPEIRKVIMYKLGPGGRFRSAGTQLLGTAEGGEVTSDLTAGYSDGAQLSRGMQVMLNPAQLEFEPPEGTLCVVAGYVNRRFRCYQCRFVTARNGEVLFDRGRSVPNPAIAESPKWCRAPRPEAARHRNLRAGYAKNPTIDELCDLLVMMPERE